MKKNQKLMLILTSILIGSLFFNFQIVKAQTDREVLLDDWFNSFTNTWNWGLMNDLETVRTGDTSQLIVIPASSQYQNIEHYFSESKDLTIWNNTYFWWYGNGTGETVQLRFMNNATDGYFATFNDNWIGWAYFGWVNYKSSWSPVASNGDWSDINRFLVVMSSNPASEFTVNLDYVFLTNGTDPLPIDTTPDPDIIQGLTSIFFGDFAFIGVIIFIILGLLVVRLWRYAGALIIPAIVFLEVQYYTLAQTNPDFIWYMLIMIFYAIGIALYSLLGKG